MITTTPALGTYDQALFDLIESVEGTRTEVYLDSVQHPTIGIGFDLKDRDVRNAVISAFGIDPGNAELDAAGQAREQYYNDQLVAVMAASYAQGDDAVVEAQLDALMAQRYEKGVKSVY